MVVEILEKTTEDYWKVRTHYRYEGYAAVKNLRTDGVEEWKSLPKKVVLHKNTCDVLSDPKVQGWCLISLPRGGRISPVGEAADGWQ